LNTQKQIVLIVALSFFFVGGCAAYSAIDLPIRSGRQSEFFQSESVERGALLFANNCRTCHGIKGQGAVGLPLNKPEFKDQDPLVLKNNRDLLQRTLYCGRAGTLMPAWLNTNGGSLNQRQIDHIIDLITEPIDPALLDEEGNPTSKGWLQAVEFAQNLNRAGAAIVGGDSLDSIARAHRTGLKELSDLNGGLGADETLKQGITVQLPATSGYPKGRTHKVLKNNETLAKVAESEHVGAAILADLNKTAYTLDSKARLTLLGAEGKAVPGLFPGEKLVLPDGAAYVVRSGDTLDAIASQHGLSVSDIQGQNRTAVGSLSKTDPIDFEAKLALPSGASVIAKAGQTLGAIATAHAVKPEDLAKASNIAADAVLKGGEKLTLPSAARYVIQRGDTLAGVAEAHAISVDDLAKANSLKATDRISPDVVLQLPKVDKFVIKGSTLEEIAAAYSAVTAESLGKANGVPANAVLRVGQSLKLPADAAGGAPPDSKNAGTACVEHAVPNSVFKTLPGVGSPAAEAKAPTDVSTKVGIDAHANDWTVTADGKAQDANKGAVLVKKGTAIDFSVILGLHTITINGKKEVALFNVGDKKTITFNDVGTFKITCDFHPEMLANVFVQ
jgi:LysM repeat protein